MDTYGITAIPASVMSSAAIASDTNDIVNNGIDIGNGINTVFDVATLVPGAAVVCHISNAERATNAAQGASLNAYNLASGALRKGLKTTAKAKKDALSRVAATSAYKKAAQEATQAAKNANFVPSSKPLNIFAQSPRTSVFLVNIPQQNRLQKTI